MSTENLVKEIAQLREAVQSAGSDRSTLDQDRLVAAFVKAMNEQKAAEAEQAIRSAAPIRKGEIIGPRGFEAVSGGTVESGKYAGKSVDELQFVQWMLDEAKRKGANVKPASKDLQGAVEKALSATGAGTGDEYVPTAMAAQLWNDFFLASRVVPAFGTIPMPTDPFDIPLGWGDPTWRKGTQNTATTASNPATAKATLTSTEQVCEVDFSYDLDEDAVIAVMPTLRELLGRSGGEQMDKFVMNADATNTATGNINLDDADPDDDSYYLSNGQDGLRHQIIVNNTGQSADINTTLTDALLRTAIGKLGKYASDPTRLVLFTNPKTYVLSMLGLTNVVTVDKFGPAATVLNGVLASYSGIPVIPTSAIELAEDDGKLSTTGSNNDEGTIVIAHRDMWRVGFRRNLLIEMYRDVVKRQMVLVASFRIAVAAHGTRSSATHTAGAHGITYS